MSHVNFHQVTEVSKWTLLIWVLYIWVKWCWCAEMFGWHIKQKEVVEECLLREAFQWPVKGFYLTGFLIACLDFWIETVLLYPDAFNHGRKPLKIMMLCLLYQALAEKQFPTTLMDPFSIVTIAVYLNRVTCSHCHLSWCCCLVTKWWPALCNPMDCIACEAPLSLGFPFSRANDTEHAVLFRMKMRCLLVTRYLFVCLKMERNKSDVLYLPNI